MKSVCAALPPDMSVDTFTLGARTGLLWSREGVRFAGLGEASRIVVTRPGGAAAAQAKLAALARDHQDGSDDFPHRAVGLGSMRFDPAFPAELIVPEVVVAEKPGAAPWLISTGPTPSEALTMIAQASKEPGERSRPSSYGVAAALDPLDWRDGVVAPVRDRIVAGDFTKVVLAREVVVDADLPIDIPAVLQNLREGFATAAIFAVDGFVGASPELLVARRGSQVDAHPLAGTAPRSSDPAIDAQLALSLASSTKDQHEHRVTIDWLLDNLLPFCSYVDAEPDPSIMTLANVHHLGTKVQGLLSSPPVSVLELVETLHPTPAVGGDPQGPALAAIAQHELGDRGHYAGPTGWVDADGNGEFAVSVRTAQIEGNRATMWAGVGVVAASDPEAELAETRIKFQTMLGAIIGPLDGPGPTNQACW